MSSSSPTPEHRQAMRRTKIAALVVVVLLALGAGRTLLSRAANDKDLAATVSEQTRQYVKVAQARRGGAAQTIALPGTLQGDVQSPIAARSAGYLKRWTKDIGSKVAKGELLAEIESPEIDQQLRQAIAAAEQAESSLALAQSTAQRWEGLRREGMASQQALDERLSASTQAQANVAALQANVQRLRQLESFKRVTAPFAGVITRRNVDVGDLIDGSKVLFVLTQADPLRVFVGVPQAYAQLIKPGQAVTVTQAELRGQKFSGKVERSAGSIDSATRTMQVEISLPNREGQLLPGAFVQVSLPLAGNDAGLIAPFNALLIRGDGTLVAVVDAQNKVSLKKVGVGRNYGSEFEVLDGISEKDRLVLNPPDWMADGQTVVVAPAEAAGATAPTKKQ